MVHSSAETPVLFRQATSETPHSPARYVAEEVTPDPLLGRVGSLVSAGRFLWVLETVVL